MANLKVFFLILTSLVSYAAWGQSFGRQADKIMLESGYSVNPSTGYLSRFSNRFQVEAVRILARNNYGDIVGKMPGILKFNNSYQVSALNIMVRRGIEIDQTIYPLAEISNPFQVKAIELLASRGYNYIGEKMPGILKFNNKYQVQALDIMTAAGYEIDSTVFVLASIVNQEQVLAVQDRVRAGAGVRQDKQYILSLRPQ